MRARTLSLQPLLLTLGVTLMLTVTVLLWARSAQQLSRSQAKGPAALPHEQLSFEGAEGRKVQVHRFSLPVQRLEIEVVDLRFTTPLADVLEDADLVVNGGFWAGEGSERRIQGLLVAQGKALAPIDEVLGGGVLEVQGGRATLVAAANYRPREARAGAGAPFALQCSPRLVVGGAPVSGLHDAPRAARTALCIRDRGRVLDVMVTATGGDALSLREFGEGLAAHGCEHALNLDGGPSTAAAFREQPGRIRRLGAGLGLPYALRFRVSRASAASAAPPASAVPPSSAAPPSSAVPPSSAAPPSSAETQANATARPLSATRDAGAQNSNLP